VVLLLGLLLRLLGVPTLGVSLIEVSKVLMRAGELLGVLCVGLRALLLPSKSVAALGLLMISGPEGAGWGLLRDNGISGMTFKPLGVPDLAAEPPPPPPAAAATAAAELAPGPPAPAAASGALVAAAAVLAAAAALALLSGPSGRLSEACWGVLPLGEAGCGAEKVCRRVIPGRNRCGEAPLAGGFGLNGLLPLLQVLLELSAVDRTLPDVLSAAAAAMPSCCCCCCWELWAARDC